MLTGDANVWQKKSPNIQHSSPTYLQLGLGRCTCHAEHPIPTQGRSTLGASLELLEGDLLGLDLRDALDGLELLEELRLERVVVGLRPRAVLVKGLRDGHLEVQAAAAHLPRDRRLGQRLDLGQVLLQQRLAGLE